MYKITDTSTERAVLCLGHQKSMDDYEGCVDQNEIASYLRSIKEKDAALLILVGGDPINGACLKILESIQHARLNVMYVVPEVGMLSEVQQRDHRIAFGVLQEYARSGVLDSMILVDRATVESLIEEVSISQYEQSIAYFISYVAAMINYFVHTEPVLSHQLSFPRICRMVTYCVGSLEDFEATNFLYDLSSTKGIHFYYGIPENDLNEDTSLVAKMKNHAKHYAQAIDTVSYSVHATTFDNVMVLGVVYTDTIQT